MQFRAIRSFIRGPGVDIEKGTLLELDDTEATLLVSLECVEPATAEGMLRLVRGPGPVTWEEDRDAVRAAHARLRRVA